MKRQGPQLWDTIANKYDDLRPDQGLTDPDIRAAWQQLLKPLLPAQKLHILDAGCGTGSLTLLLHQMGHETKGVDFSPEMINVARSKAKSMAMPVDFSVGDASTPSAQPKSLDAIICRQVLWALPDPTAALDNWTGLLKQNGKIILIEGHFASGNGLDETEIRNALPESLAIVLAQDLSRREPLWGGPIPDQRLLIVAQHAENAQIL